MSLESLKQRMPDYAKDIKLNLSNIASSTTLTEAQLWGAMLASALAARNPAVVEEIAEEAKQHLSPAAQNAAKAANAVMAMNNVYYRATHMLSDAEFGKMPARLRMSVIANPGVDKLDFELWSLAVSAINGCGKCMDAHAREVAAKGASREAVQDVLRIAAVVHAAASVLDGEAVFAGARAAAA